MDSGIARAQGGAMEWRDQGVVLAVRRHGESAAIVEVFTESHGRHLGVVRGGGGRRFLGGGALAARGGSSSSSAASWAYES